ncbi:serine hydrolase domain-containing protein [Pontimicrobium aquaticum]|uniref:Serine hydrolase n=1 Tax=Pontimicrobium aquaticum TaxID=2565367 RepID=A0A4U0EYH4_9FLAO|nr:serine hydrolase [Pontimicrobium aquaticum]TJY37077.1 serine hydrolase [Pontimicrobium aquaticum]
MQRKYFITLFIFFTCKLVLLAQTFPGNEWEYNQQAAAEGWNIEKSMDLHRFLTDSTKITSLLVVHKGKIIFQYGDVEQTNYIASCRKSILSMLYGKYVLSGQIDLGMSIKDLKIDDINPLLPIEKEATIEDLISARSGIYLPASNAGTWVKYLKKRGTIKPGTRWLYNNWDFNTAGFIFENQTGKNIYDAVQEQLVLPLNMQDWNRSRHQKVGDTTKSKYLAYPMWFSTRDLARVGLLMLNKGKWRDKQVIPKIWVDEMVKTRTTAKEMQESVPVMKESNYDYGYGYMWWLWENPSDTRLNNAYSALGAYGQNITVVPEKDLVIVFNTKAQYNRSNSSEITQELPSRIVNIFKD